MTDAADIWKDVLGGRVRRAIASTRAARCTGIRLADPCSVVRPAALYLEPSLTCRNGHQWSLASCYDDLLHSLGYRNSVFHAHGSGLPKRPNWHPYFLVPHHTLALRAIETESELGWVERYFASEFGRLIEAISPQLCVFATVRFTNVAAAAMAVTKAGQGGGPKVIFGVMEAADVPDCEDPDIVRSAFVRAAAMLQNYGTPHLVMAETDLIQDFLLGCGFLPEHVRVYPYVAAMNIVDTSAIPKRMADDIHFGYLGGSRPVRNPELIADLLSSGSFAEGIHWSVQFDLDYLRKKSSQSVVSKLLKMHKAGTIALYRTGLSEDKYRKLFCSLDFILMPYSSRYQHIGSGVLLEAIYAGVIPIVPRNSSMDRLYRSLGGAAPSFEALSVSSIKEALVEAVNRRRKLARDAAIVRERWLRHPWASQQWEAELGAWLHENRFTEAPSKRTS